MTGVHHPSPPVSRWYERVSGMDHPASGVAVLDVCPASLDEPGAVRCGVQDVVSRDPAVQLGPFPPNAT